MNRTTRNPSVLRRSRVDTRSIRLAVAAALLIPALAQSQADPYQSPKREAYGDRIGQTELPKGGYFEPRIDAALQYVDNLNTTPDGEKQVNAAGLEMAPGFYASYSSGAAVAAVDYSLIARAWDDSDYNDVSHDLAANGVWHAVPEWLQVTGQASYGSSILDPAAGLNYGGIGVFNPSNMSEVATVGVSPVLSHEFKDFQATAQYQYGRTWFLDEGLGLDTPTVGFVGEQDSEDQSARVSIGTSHDPGRKLTGTAYYDWQESVYELALPYRYERAGIDGGLRVGRTVTLLGEYGKESDLDQSTTQGGLDSEYWTAGLRYEPNERTSMEGRYGERFFGDAWSARLMHRARLVEFTAAYSEEPTVETRMLSLGEFDPGTLPPGTPPGFDFGRLNNAPFVARNGSFGISAVGSHTEVTLTGYNYERDYISELRRDETNLGASLEADRELASNLSANLSISYSDYENATPDLLGGEDVISNYKDTTVVFRIDRQTGKSLTLGAEAGYLMRTGDAEYDGWWTALRARWFP